MANRNIKKTKKKAGKHSSPATSGEQNMPRSYVNKNKGTGGDNMESLLGAVKKGRYNLGEYKGLWTEELLAKEIMDYFEYCVKTEMKPAKAGLRLWLGLSKSQYYEWEQGNITDGWKTNLLEEASNFMEMQYIQQGEQYPTMNIFLLKSAHNHSDKQEVEISGKEVDSNDIADVVAKLGLDKTE